jgi:hypothetical protein
VLITEASADATWPVHLDEELLINAVECKGAAGNTDHRGDHYSH